MTAETWIVVANSSKARIFRLETRDVLEELDGLVHSESRLREGDLVADRVGRQNDRFGGGKHAMEQELPPHKRQAHRFAGELAHYLKKAFESGSFKRLHIAASPTFLGLLRQRLDVHTKAVVVGEVDKDITTLTPPKIREHLPYAL